MRACNILRSSLKNALSKSHRARSAAVWLAVAGLLIGGRLSLTALGRATPRRTSQKHRIKSIDNLLGNENLHRELPVYYAALAAFVLKQQQRPVILVDWTPVGAGSESHALVASVPIGGRAIAIYEEVHPEKLLQSRKVEGKFLKRLASLLRPDCVPVIVTDAGFRTPWFDAVKKLNWEFVGRLRNRTLVQGNDDWFPAKDLYARATRRPKDLGIWKVTKRRPRKHRLVIINKRKRGAASRKRRTRRGKPVAGTSRRDKRCSKAAREPWLLVTSLEDKAAKEIVGIYRTRMQIEETFRDIKSHRYGWSFEDARSDSPERLNVLLLIAALGAVAVLIVGTAAEQQGFTRHYQANTVRNRRVLSVFFLGKTVMADGMGGLPTSALREALVELRRRSAEFSLDSRS